MKKLTDSYISEHLQNGIVQLKRTNPEALWDQPVEKAKGDEWYLEGMKVSKKRNKKVFQVMASMAACLAICFVSYYLTTMQVESMVYLDVNPSIEIQLNKKEQVVDVEAKNADAEIILEDMKWNHTDMDVAVNAIIGSMVKHGYIDEAKNMILLSVESRDPAKADALRTQISEEIHLCLDSLVGSGTVYNQNIELEDALEKMAQEHGMTPGKAALIQKIIEQHPELQTEKLAEMKMHELIDYLEDAGVEVEEYVDVLDDDHEAEPDDEDDSEDPEEQEVPDDAKKEEDAIVSPGKESQTEIDEPDTKEDVQDEDDEEEEQEQDLNEDTDTDADTDDKKKPNKVK